MAFLLTTSSRHAHACPELNLILPYTHLDVVDGVELVLEAAKVRRHTVALRHAVLLRPRHGLTQRPHLGVRRTYLNSTTKRQANPAKSGGISGSGVITTAHHSRDPQQTLAHAHTHTHPHTHTHSRR